MNNDDQLCKTAPAQEHANVEPLGVPYGYKWPLESPYELIGILALKISIKVYFATAKINVLPALNLYIFNLFS